MDEETLIVFIQNELDSSYAQIGVTAIRWEGRWSVSSASQSIEKSSPNKEAKANNRKDGS